MVSKKFDRTAGVQCESLPRGRQGLPQEEDHDRPDVAVSKGLVLQSEKVCVACHNDESPAWDPDRYTRADGSKVGFDYDQAVEDRSTRSRGLRPDGGGRGGLDHGATSPRTRRDTVHRPTSWPPGWCWVAGRGVVVGLISVFAPTTGPTRAAPIPAAPSPGRRAGAAAPARPLEDDEYYPCSDCHEGEPTNRTPARARGRARRPSSSPTATSGACTATIPTSATAAPPLRRDDASSSSRSPGASAPSATAEARRLARRRARQAHRALAGPEGVPDLRRLPRPAHSRSSSRSSRSPRRCRRARSDRSNAPPTEEAHEGMSKTLARRKVRGASRRQFLKTAGAGLGRWLARRAPQALRHRELLPEGTSASSPTRRSRVIRRAPGAQVLEEKYGKPFHGRRHRPGRRRGLRLRPRHLPLHRLPALRLRLRRGEQPVARPADPLDPRSRVRARERDPRDRLRGRNPSTTTRRCPPRARSTCRSPASSARTRPA